MKKFPISIVLLLLTLFVSGKDYELFSPDKSIKVIVRVTNTVSFSVSIENDMYIKPSAISMDLVKYGVLGEKAVVKKVKTRNVNEIIEPVVWQKTKIIKDDFQELVLEFKGNYSIVFRAYNNGIAYQFQTRFKEEIVILSEMANYNFQNNYTVFFPEEVSLFSHNERSYLKKSLDSISANNFASLPTLISTEKNVKILLTESSLTNYPGMWIEGGKQQELNAIFPSYPLDVKLKEGSDRSEPVTKSADYIAKTRGTRSFPWRIFAIAKEDKDLLTNQLSYQLAEPVEIEDPSWIKPGKVAWDWWNYNNIYRVDFKAGVNTETYKYYIDFASKYGLEYIILDEGWYVLGDLMHIVPEINIEEIVAYGKEKNVGIILWVVWKTLDDQLEEAMAQFEKWGVKGLKVDFMQRDDQVMVNYYHKIAKEAAKRKMLVDFHGSYKPSGLRRKYPNVITREGVKGLEHNKWGEAITPEHNVTIPFIRMVAGPMDYTPGAMVNAQPKNFEAIWNRPMSMGTRCHQMAMYVIYESPLQMLADNPSNYLKEAECTEFISKVPTVWEDTKILEASVGDYIITARKSGENWFIGAMTDENEREFELDLSFLPNAEYTIEVFQDGMNADRYASDYKKLVYTINPKITQKIKLAPGGGWVARVY